MRTVMSVVETLVKQDEIALESMRAGYLNLSSFAKEIHSLVEEHTMKSVQVGTIVVALSRLQARVSEIAPLFPPITIRSIDIQSPLVDISFEKTRQTLDDLSVFQATMKETSDVVSVTIGSHEITIIADAHMKERIVSAFRAQPVATYEQLVGIRVRFSPEYLTVPNVLYTLMHVLAKERINIVEVVSTYTEMTFVIDATNLQTCIKAFEPYLQKLS